MMFGFAETRPLMTSGIRLWSYVSAKNADDFISVAVALAVGCMGLCKT